MYPSRTSLLAALTLAGSLAACGRKAKDQAAETSQISSAPTAAVAATPAASAAPVVEATPATAAAAATFDLSTVPVSNASLGKFPYLTGLRGYTSKRHVSDSVGYDFERSYVYDGKNLIPVEGKVVRRDFNAVDDQKKASELQVQRNYEDLIKQLGGVKVFSGKIPQEAIDKLGKDEFEKHSPYIYNSTALDTYLIRQKDKEVWVQVRAGESEYYLYVTERAAMPQQATTLKADELKKN